MSQRRHRGEAPTSDPPGCLRLLRAAGPLAAGTLVTCDPAMAAGGGGVVLVDRERAAAWARDGFLDFASGHRAFAAPPAADVDEADSEREIAPESEPGPQTDAREQEEVA